MWILRIANSNARHFSCEWGKIDIDILGFACMRFVSMINSNSHSDPYRVWSFSNKTKLFFKCLRLVSKKKWKRSWRKEKREGKKFGVLGLKSYFVFVYHWINLHWEKLGKASFDFSQRSNSYLPWSGGEEWKYWEGFLSITGRDLVRFGHASNGSCNY